MMDLRERAKAEIMSLTEEECVKRAASGVTSTESGRAEQVETAVSASIVAK